MTLFIERLRDQVKESLSFFESRELPRKNTDMKELQLEAKKMNTSLTAAEGDGEKRESQGRLRMWRVRMEWKVWSQLKQRPQGQNCRGWVLGQASQ